MSKIRQEISSYISDIRNTFPDMITASIIFPSEFTGFKGHFPKQKILPGVCQIQAVLEIIHQWLPNVCLEEITMAKFFSPVGSKEKLTITCSKELIKNDRYRIKAQISCENRKISYLHLIVS